MAKNVKTDITLQVIHFSKCLKLKVTGNSLLKMLKVKGHEGRVYFLILSFNQLYVMYVGKNKQ